jgi:hypothetical protein
MTLSMLVIAVWPSTELSRRAAVIQSHEPSPVVGQWGWPLLVDEQVWCARAARWLGAIALLAVGGWWWYAAATVVAPAPVRVPSPVGAQRNAGLPLPPSLIGPSWTSVTTRAATTVGP